ncbi:hypothetical protein [Brevibacillus fulvus]|uniref:Uncharacterized protein n=1 Tax=Brevibacillus fulvus TaxID=1125967 RepID=A0A938Y2W6_9BACL|nr:hypothetical protein [Brevibacillus fulvus]MBM7592310.1 hypothetical protein [Brevibacillus fulvus]
MSKMFFIFLACIMVLGIGVSSYGNQLSPAANDSASNIHNSVSSLNYDANHGEVEFIMQNGNTYTEGN